MQRSFLSDDKTVMGSANVVTCMQHDATVLVWAEPACKTAQSMPNNQFCLVLTVNGPWQSTRLADWRQDSKLHGYTATACQCSGYLFFSICVYSVHVGIGIQLWPLHLACWLAIYAWLRANQCLVSKNVRTVLIFWV